MRRHTIGNPRYETADIRRPVSSHRINQTGVVHRQSVLQDLVLFLFSPNFHYCYSVPGPKICNLSPVYLKKKTLYEHAYHHKKRPSKYDQPNKKTRQQDERYDNGDAKHFLHILGRGRGICVKVLPTDLPGTRYRGKRSTDYPAQGKPYNAPPCSCM